MAARPIARQVYRGAIPVLAGARIVRQSIKLRAGGLGHVYYNAAKGEWYEVAVHGRGSWIVTTYQGGSGDCPCSG